mmetsp:Transcript_108184/g.304778  ORF Transcript_108184/g.304778 Transcript_108184/m.304778 type:complete len:831 (+) Transcript_108184:85-2577(+)
MSCFSDKTWSGTPMWQIKEELEAVREKRDAEERRKASTPVAVLNVRVLGDHQLCELVLLIPPKASSEAKPDPTSGGFREVKVRGPRRKTRAEALKDGFELRASFYSGGEAEVRRKQKEVQAKTWAPSELPPADASVEEKADQEQRLRLAQRPWGTGWSRKKDAEFFVHTHAPMAYDPKKRQYFITEASTHGYVPCDPPHDPVEYPVTVSAGASLVGKSERDLVLADRPRTLLLKELVKTGVAMKRPLFFLDQPAACFVLFEGVRGSAAVDYCSKNFHTKLLAKLSSSLQYWSDAMVEGLLRSIFEELDTEILQQSSTCYDGVSLAVAISLGDRMTLATLGAARGLLIAPGGKARVLGLQHRVADEGPERQRVDTACGEVVSFDKNGVEYLAVRRPMLPRETAICQEQEAEIKRILRCSPDSFAALGFGPDDAVDAKTAKASYRKLALKVHPDKAPEELRAQAKEAFSKVEVASERIETLCDTDSAATAVLHKVLASAGSVDAAVMPRAWACAILGMDPCTSPPEDAEHKAAELKDAEKKATELRDTLGKLGRFADGRLAQPDCARAGQLLDDALDVLAAPPLREGVVLEPVAVTRALGLRDLKKPRPIVSGAPELEVVQLNQVGGHHLALLSSSTAVLSDEEITSKIKGFSRQPKAASLIIAQDAAVRQEEKGAPPAACLASSIVGVFDVAEEKAEEPMAKKARVEQDKVRCLHILLKHKDLKMQKDPGSVQRLRGKPPTTRTLPQAEKELLEMQRALAENPNIFHVFARKHSECDTAIQPGQSAGDLGWLARGALGLPHFDDVMFGLGVYEVSDIVTTPRGLHIIQRVA